MAEQVCSADYKPTTTDIFQGREADDMGGTKTRMLNCNFIAARCDASSNKWIQQFENIDGLVYVVGLADYDTWHLVSESLRRFDPVVQSRRLRQSTVLL